MKYLDSNLLLNEYNIMSRAETEFCKFIHSYLKEILEEGDEIRFKTPLNTGSHYAPKIYAVMNVKGIIMAEYDYKHTGKITCCDKAVQPYYANIQEFTSIAFAITDSKIRKTSENILFNKGIHSKEGIVVCI